MNQWEENILNELNQIQNNLDVFYTQITEKLSTMKRNLQKYSTLHQNCRQKGYQDFEHTTISYDEAKELADEKNDNPVHILIDKTKDENKDKNQIVKVATDGSIINRHARKIAAFGVYFAEASPINQTGIVKDSSSTLIPEVAGINKAISIAKEEGITNLLIITDNMASITLTTLAIQSPINSRSLQNYIDNNPVIGDFCEQINKMSKHFQFLGIQWQKSHTNYASTNAILNNGADQLARARAEELLRIITS